jgi:hypothetical protein
MNVNNNMTEYINNLYAENQQLAFRLKNAEDSITNIKNYLETQYLEVHASQIKNIENNNNTCENNNNNNTCENNNKEHNIKSLSVSINFPKEYDNIIFNIIKIINIKRAFECSIDMAQRNLINNNTKSNIIVAASNVAYACIEYMCNPCKSNIDVILNSSSTNNEVNIDISVNTIIDMETLKSIKNAIYEAIIFKIN